MSKFRKMKVELWCGECKAYCEAYCKAYTVHSIDCDEEGEPKWMMCTKCTTQRTRQFGSKWVQTIK